MTDQTPETVAVPVELLRRVLNPSQEPSDALWQLEQLLPKPKPRLVAVNLDDYANDEKVAVYEMNHWPDLLTLLDAVADGLADRGWLSELGVQNLRADIRAALGVSE